MLGRVGWNLILNPHSLVASLLKASYYHGLLRQRISWRIGSGSAMPIWLEPWLPNRANPFIILDFETSVGAHYVSDLIQDGTWNREVLSQVFNDRDRNLILSLPIKQQLWKKIWSLQLIPKVKNFIWCAYILVSRHIPIQDVCPFYLVESEIVFHALISCQFARQVWRASYLGWFSPPSATFTEWLWKILNLFNGSDVALALVLCWCLWEAHNKCIWQQQTSAAVQIWSNT
uniref:Reverse transcriptase zinc-binding domain-containing protein n=1 Tax=Manihot esculenta TaxID=3983 RepID=A0A2C9UVF2_MANES